MPVKSDIPNQDLERVPVRRFTGILKSPVLWLLVGCVTICVGCASQKPHLDPVDSDVAARLAKLRTVALVQPRCDVILIDYWGKPTSLSNRTARALEKLAGLVTAQLKQHGFTVQQIELDAKELAGHTTLESSNELWDVRAQVAQWEKENPPQNAASEVKTNEQATAGSTAKTPSSQPRPDALVLVKLWAKEDTGSRAARKAFAFSMEVTGGVAVGGGLVMLAVCGGGGSGGGDWGSAVLGYGMLGALAFEDLAWYATGGGKISEYSHFDTVGLQIVIVDAQSGGEIWEESADSKSFSGRKLDELVAHAFHDLPQTVSPTPLPR
jgi:hypothetical protein